MRFRKPLAALAAACALFVAACGGNTTGATEVTSSTAKLNFQGHCNTDDAGRVYVEHQLTSANPGTDPWTRTYGPVVLPDGPDAGTDPDPCTSRTPASGEAPGNIPVSSLSQNAEYRYRVGFDFTDPGGDAYTDSTGTPNPGGSGTYDTFRTCKAVASGTSFSSAISGVPSGGCIDLAAGSYNWDQSGAGYNPPAGVTIKARDGVSATITGEARVNADNVTLSNLTLRPDPSEDHATLYINADADNFVGEWLDVSANHIDFVMPVLSSGTPSNATLRDSEIHGAAGNGLCFEQQGGTGSRTHAIYWSAGEDATFERLWLYDYTGYGLHFYGPGSVNGSHVERVVSDSRMDCDPLNQLGNVKDTGGSDAITVNKSITEGGNWKCLDGGVTLTNSRMTGTRTGCTDGGGNTTGSTSFNSSTDLRVAGNPDFQFVPGPK